MGLFELFGLFGLSYLSCHFIKKTFLKSYSESTAYCLLHLINNGIMIWLCTPYFIALCSDPLGLKDYSYPLIRYTYPILCGLHTYHLTANYKKINNDELFHHTLSYVFWILSEYFNHPFYFINLICMSGLPGGITYLLLFLQKNNIIQSITEKRTSMYVNYWIRGPGCIIYSTLLGSRIILLNLSGTPYYLSMFIAFFSFVNGVHFTTTITESYYRSLYAVK